MYVVSGGMPRMAPIQIAVASTQKAAVTPGNSFVAGSMKPCPQHSTTQHSKAHQATAHAAAEVGRLVLG